jgi:putative ABC transport system permease protein
MRSLDKKLLRDLRRLWAQALAVALVMAAGVATIVLALGAYRSLDRTREAFYERQRFADVFASVSRAPRSLRDTLERIPGVSAVDLRVTRFALIDVPGMGEPGTGVAIGLNDGGPGELNAIYLRSGRMPGAASSDEVIVNEAFATAHGFRNGGTFNATMNGRRRSLRIVGTVLSPGYIYALGPGDMMPDDRRFVVFWMSEKALAGIFDLSGAFNDVAVKLTTAGREAEVIRQLDHALVRYGGVGAYGRSDHASHAFLDGELRQLAAMGRTIPPIFLFVSAFLINMILSRLITLEREQIGLLKAMGYFRSEVAAHYAKLVLTISAVGIAIGAIAGTWLADGLTKLYGKFFRFPYLILQLDADLYLISGGVTAAAALAGALKAIREALLLAPAVAMQPPAPPRYRRLLPHVRWRLPAPHQITVMSFRHMLRWPVRAATTAVGIALSVSVLIVAFFTFDAVEHMIDVSFFQIERQHASLVFSDNRPARIVHDVGQLPGVMRVEPYRSVAVRIRHGHLERKLSLSGKPIGRVLSRVLDRELKPIALPSTGIVISQRLAQVLDLKRGDEADIEVLDGKRLALKVLVADVIASYFGLLAYMDLDALNALLGDGHVIRGVHLAYDPVQEPELFARIKSTPAIGSVVLQSRSILRFRETLAENIAIMSTVYIVLSCIIAFGVVYNSARIQLSERARELATLRVLGLTRAEVSWVLLIELTVLSVIAVPLGWVLGNRFAWLTVQGFTSDLYSVPFAIEYATYAKATLIVLFAALVSTLIVRRRIDRFDLVSVLKARD